MPKLRATKQSPYYEIASASLPFGLAMTGRALVLALIISVIFAGAAFCLPEVDEIQNGAVDIQTANNVMTINASNNAIVNYKSFNVMQNESLIINLPSADSQILNRVVGPGHSEILGSIQSNGIFILVNPNGIYVGPQARIDAASAILSTRDISNQRFINGEYLFNKLGQGEIDRLLLNEGVIKVSEGGFCALIAGAIENKGIITAKYGTIALAAGNAIRLELAGNHLIGVAVEEAVAAKVLDYEGNPVLDQIKNTGTLDAEGGTVILQARSVEDIFQSLINTQGIIKATHLEEHDGVIEFVAEGGTVEVAGTIEATEVKIGSLPQNAVPNVIMVHEEAVVQAEKTVTMTAVELIEINTTIQAPTVNLTTDGLIDTAPGAIIQGTTVTLNAYKFGATGTPVTIDADNIIIRRLNGDIDIRESIGLGSSIWIRGPPEGDSFGEIIYNQNASQLTLEGRSVYASGISAQTTVIVDGSLVLKAENSIGSAGQPFSFHAGILAGATAQNGSITLDSGDTDILIGGDIRAYGDIDIYAGTGVIDIRGDNVVIGSTTGSINLETTTGNIIVVGTIAAPEGTIRLWTSRTLDVMESILYSKDGSFIWNPEDEIAVTWDRGAGTNNWEDANNWNPNGVPNTNAYRVVITKTGGGGYTINTAADYTIGALSLGTSGNKTCTINLGGNLTIDNGDPTVIGAGDLAVGDDGVFNANNYTVSVMGSLSVTGGGTFNAGTGTVIYSGPNTQTINSAIPYYHLATAGSGTKSLSGTTTVNGNLTIGTGTTLNVSGNTFTVNGTTTVNGTLTHSLTTGTKTYVGLVTVPGGGNWNNIGNSPITLCGGITNNGTFTAGTGVYTFTTNNQALNGTFSIPNVTVTGITLTNNGSLTVGTSLSGSGTLAQAANATLNINVAGTLGIANLNASASGNTVNYGYAGNQTVKAATYHNLVTAGSGTKSLSGTTTVNGNLTIGTGTTLNVSGNTFTVNGTTTVNGTLTHSLTTGTKTYVGLVTVPGGGNWNNIGNSPITLCGGITNNGVFTAGTGLYTFNTNAQALNGTISIPNVTVTGITLTNNGSLTVGTSLSGSGTLAQAANATLNIGGTSGITGLTAAASGNTVIYSDAIQTVKPTTYYNLTLSGSGVKTTTGVTVNGVLSMEGTATASAAPTYGAAATLRYNTATSRTAGPEWLATFAATGGVVIANTGTITLNGAKVFGTSVPLTINSGATLNTSAANNYALTFGGNYINNGGALTANGSAITITGTMASQSIAGFTTTGTVSMTKTAGTATFTGNVNGAGLTLNGSGGTLNLGTGRTHTFTGTWTRTAGTLDGGSSTLNLGGTVSGTGGTFTAGTGTVNYTGGTLTISPLTYYNLGLLGTGTKSLGGATTVNGNLTISGCTLSAGTYTLSVGGNWQNSGTFTAGTGTVIFAGTGTSVISGSNTFYNLTCTTGGKQLTFTAGTTQTITGTLTLTGSTGNYVVLRSSVPGSQWMINPSPLRNVSFVDVRDSNNTTLPIINPTNSLNSGNNTNWFPVITGSISGYVYIDLGTTAIANGAIIVLVKDGVVQGSTTTGGGSGYYIFSSVSMTGGEAFLVYIDNNAVHGTTVTIGAGAAITGLNIYGETVIVRHEAAGQATIATFATAKGALTDTDILYATSGGNLTVNGNLYIWTGKTFTPGGNIQINNGGFLNYGTFTHGSGTVAFNATATGYNIKSNGSAFYNMDFTGTGIYTLQDDLTIAGSLTFKGYSYYRHIVIDHTKVGETLTNYPLLFSVTDPNLRTTADGGFVTSTMGYDIAFYDSLGNKLDWQIEQYDGPTGKIVAWIRMPTLSNTVDTTIYIYYGDTSITSSQESSTAVWDANYLGVWHMSQTPPLPIYDSTAYDNQGQSVPGSNPQQIYFYGHTDGSIHYDGYGDGTVVDDFLGTGISALTVQAWVAADIITAGTVTGAVLVDQPSASYASPYSSFALTLGPTVNNSNFAFAITDSATSTRTVAQSGNNTANTTDWILVTGVWNGSTITLYVNGAASGTPVAKTGTLANVSTQVAFGYYPYESDAANLIGALDEIRISNTARSAGWILTDYNSQSSPATFMSVGSQTLVPGPTINAGSHNVTIAGNVSMARGSFNAGTSTVTLNGAAAQRVITGNSALYNLVVANTSSFGAYLSGSLIVTNALTINTGALLDLQNKNLTATGAVFSNEGTLKLEGGQTLTGLVMDTNSGTIEYNGESHYTGLAAGNDYWNLTFSSAGIYTLTADVNVDGTLTFISAYNYYKPLIIDHTKVAEALTDFPVLIQMNADEYPGLKHTSYGGYVTNIEGYDILFTDPDNNRLSFEIEKYDPVTGELIAWVKVPTLSASDDTTIYMYYGNKNTVRESKEDIPGTWDANYLGVWHMAEKAGPVQDSTAGENDGTAFQGVQEGVSAKIDGGDWYNGTTSYVSTGLYSDEMTNVTFSVWFKADKDYIGGYYDVYLEERLITQRRTGGVEGQTSRISLLLYEDTVCAFYYNGSNNRINGGPSIVDHDWHQAVVTYDGATLTIYTDGAYSGSVSVSNLTTPSHEFIEFGRQTLDLRYFEGTMDEAHISNLARTAGWIGTEYNNQSSPSTFYSVGTQGTGILSNKIVMGSHTITIAQDLANDGGVLAGTGAVVFDSAAVSHITGRTIFPNLTCVTPGKSLIFEANKTQTILGTLTLNGQTAGNEIVLDSSDGTNRFTLQVLGDQSVNRVNVSNSQVSSLGGTYNVTANNSIQGPNTDAGEAAPHWVFVIPSYTLSGQVYTARPEIGGILVGSGMTVGLVINGIYIGSVDTNASSTYTFTNLNYAETDAILVGILGEAIQGNTVTTAVNANITGLDIYGDTVIVRHETAGPVTNDTLATAAGAIVSGDILYDVTGSNLTTAADLLVWDNKTYTPGGTVAAKDIVIRGGGRYTAEDHDITAAGSWVNSGTFTHGGAKVTFTSAAAGRTITSGGSHFDDVAFTGAGGWTLADSFVADGDFTISAGTVYSDGYAMTIGGDWENNGSFNHHDDNTVTFNGTGSRTIKTGGTGDGKAFWNLVLTGGATYTLSGNDLEVENDLSIVGPSYANGYYYRKPIAIDAAEGTQDLANFAVLYSVTDPDLRGVAYGGKVTNANGYDIIFTDASGTTLDFEIEKYDPATGTYIGWFRVPTLSASAGTDVYLYYGNSAISSSQENAPGVWDADYLGVWHMAETPPAAVVDSTSPANNMTTAGSPQSYPAGQISSAIEFSDTTSDRLYAADFLGGNITSLTVSGWVKLDEIENFDAIINQTSGLDTSFALGIGDSSNFSYTIRTGSGTQLVSTAAGSAEVGEWAYVVGVWDGYAANNNMRMFVDGEISGTPNSGQIGTMTDYTTDVNMAYNAAQGAGSYLDGVLDEIRISQTARSAEWVATQYANQSDPSSFYAVGPESTSATTVFDTGIQNVTVGRDITNNRATITANDSTITVARNWASSNGGVMNPGTSTVVFAGATGSISTITGETIFYNLTSEVPSKELQFESGKTQTIGGTLVLDGQDEATRITIRSTTPGVRHTLDVTGGDQAAFFVDVQDSQASSHNIYANYAVNSGDNDDLEPEPHWIFYAGGLFYWVGPGTDWGSASNWAVFSGGSLHQVRYPQGPNDVVIFDGNGTGNAILTSAVSVASIDIQGAAGPHGAYTGTIDLSAGDLTVAGDLAISSGTLIAPAAGQGFNVGGDWTKAGGSFDANDGTVTFTGASGTQTITTGGTGAGNSFNNITHSGAGTLSLGADDLEMTGAFYNAAGTFNTNNRHITLGGDWTNEGVVGIGTSSVTFNGSAAQAVTSGGYGFYDMTVANSTPYAGVYLKDALSVTHGLAISEDAVLDLAQKNLTATGASFSNDGVLKLDGIETVTGLAMDTDSGTVLYYGSRAYTGLAAGNNYHNLTFDGVGSYSLTAPLDVNGALTLDGYDYKIPLTIDHTQVAGPLTDFPVLVSMTDPNLRTIANGGKVTDPSGKDIVFTDVTCIGLSHELEYYDPVTGTIVAWVKVPAVSDTVDTVININYGNEWVTTSLQDPAAVWGTNYQGVWHLTADLTDSTSQANDGIDYGTSAAAGIIGPARSFNDAQSDYISVLYDLSQWLGGTSSVSAWVNTTQVGNDTMWQAPGLTGIEESGGGNDVFWGWIDATGHMGIMAGNTDGAKTTNPVNTGTWQYLVFTRDATTGGVTVSVNGGTAVSATSEVGVMTNAFYSIGRIEDTGGTPVYYNGIIDEFRVMTTTKTATWNTTEYNNQVSPATFMTPGTETKGCAAKLAAGTHDITVAGDWNNDGVFLPGTATVIFDGPTATLNTGGTGYGKAFNKVVINATGTKVINGDTLINDVLEVNAGTLAGVYDVTVKGGSVTGDGRINMTGGIFTVEGTGNFGGSGTDWTFNGLTFGDGTTTAATTKTGSNNINVTNVLMVRQYHTLYAGAYDWNLSWASYLKDIAEITAGYDHTVALTTDGYVFAWGSNYFGQIGDGTLVDSLVPTQVLGGEQGGEYLQNIEHIAAGGYHTLALTDDGYVYSWGYNGEEYGGYGQLGTGTALDATTPVRVVRGDQPAGTGDGATYLHDIASIAAYGFDSAAVTTGGQALTWGYNYDGELGDNSTIDRFAPVYVVGVGGTGTLQNVSQISAGGLHMAALTTTGTVYTWGYNGDGELGNGTLIDSLSPVQVVGLGGVGFLDDIIMVSAGDSHVLALGKDGFVYAWGFNYYAELGDGTTIDKNTPVRVLAGAQGGGTYLHDIVRISAGTGHSIAVAEDGFVYAWGSNYVGQLGDGTKVDALVPVQMLAGDQELGTYLQSITLVAAGGDQTITLSEHNALFAVGNNANGELGNGGTVEELEDVRVLAGSQAGPDIIHVPLIVEGTLDTQTSTFNFQQDTYHHIVTIAPVRYWNLNLATNPTGEYILGGDIVVAGDITIGTATFRSDDHNITLGGNWSNEGGIFSAGTGTVILDGTAAQTITAGGSPFHTLTVNNYSDDGIIFADRLLTGTLNAAGGVKKLSFSAASYAQPHQITTAFNVDGVSAGSLLELVSTNPGSVWYIDAPAGSHTYLHVEDSYAVTGTQTATSSTGSNNTNWNITP